MSPSDPPKNGSNTQERTSGSDHDSERNLENSPATLTDRPSTRKHKSKIAHNTADDARNWLKSIKDFFKETDKIIAVFTGFLVLIGFGALRIQRDTEVRQLRAYVGPAPSGSALSYWPPTNQYTAHIRFLNSGATPAFKISVSMNVKVLPYPIAGEDIFTAYPITPQPNGSETLFSQDFYDATKNSDGTLTQTDFLDVLSGDSKRRIFAYGIASYVDAFGNQRRTLFCVSYTNAGVNDPMMSSSGSGHVAAERCVLGNDAD